MRERGGRGRERGDREREMKRERKGEEERGNVPPQKTVYT